MNIETNEKVNLEGVSSEKILEMLYGKELNSKKSILEFSTIIKDNKDNLTAEQMQEVYNLIYKSIEKMSSVIKANTIMYLKNQLKSALGKYVEEKDPKEVNHFIEFFKKAYPAGNRRKGFTWVIMDINKITEEQIWNTLTYIVSWCSEDRFNKLSDEEKDDIIDIVEVLVNRNKIKYINQLKSFDKLQKILNIKIISSKEKYKVKRM